jgi:hypothetical protein
MKTALDVVSSRAHASVACISSKDFGEHGAVLRRMKRFELTGASA